MKPARGSSRLPTRGARQRCDEFKWLPVRVTDARLDALIARGYLAANEARRRPRCSGGPSGIPRGPALRRSPPLGLADKIPTETPAGSGGTPKRDALHLFLRRSARPATVYLRLRTYRLSGSGTVRELVRDRSAGGTSVTSSRGSTRGSERGEGAAGGDTLVSRVIRAGIRGIDH